MAKFTVVSEAPATLEKGEIVLTVPNFIEQIRENAKKAPRLKQTGINHLREVLNSIGVKYDPDMNVMRFKLVNYQGVPYKDDAEFSAIITRILKNEYPTIFDKVLEHQLQHRPPNTKLIYYVGDFNSTSPFYKAGLDFIEAKDVESYMTGKPKKTVGKPAVTDEEANARGTKA